MRWISAAVSKPARATKGEAIQAPSAPLSIMSTTLNASISLWYQEILRWQRTLELPLHHHLSDRQASCGPLSRGAPAAIRVRLIPEPLHHLFSPLRTHGSLSSTTTTPDPTREEPPATHTLVKVSDNQYEQVYRKSCRS